jgi:dynein heavy chain
LKKIETYTKKDTFKPDFVSGKSFAAGALCLWVRSLEDYSKALKVVAPKRAKKEHALAKLREAEEELAKLEGEF